MSFLFSKMGFNVSSPLPSVYLSPLGWFNALTVRLRVHVGEGGQF